MSPVKGIHHVCIKCSSTAQYKKVQRFYGEALELPVRRSWDGGMMYDAGGSLIEIFTDAECDLPQGAIRHFALATDDPDECVRRVREAGYPVTVEPKDVLIASNPPLSARVAFCEGPVGEEIEFFQERQ